MDCILMWKLVINITKHIISADINWKFTVIKILNQPFQSMAFWGACNSSSRVETISQQLEALQ